MSKPRLFQSKNEQVYTYLREAILDSRIEPGTALVIDGLAADLGVSQIPIREALRQLEADGFVVIEPYVGARVTELQAASIHEIFDLLEALEVISGRAACKLLSSEDLDYLSGLIDAMRGLLDDPDGWSEQNKHLHQTICERAQMHLVKLSLSRALDHWDRLRRRYLTEVFASRIKLAQQEHERLIDALRNRDADQVEAIVREHNRVSLRAYIDMLETQGSVLTHDLTPDPSP